MDMVLGVVNVFMVMINLKDRKRVEHVIAKCFIFLDCPVCIVTIY